MNYHSEPDEILPKSAKWTKTGGDAENECSNLSNDTPNTKKQSREEAFALERLI